VDATDVMVPEQGNDPAPQVKEQEKKQEVTPEPKKEDQQGG